MLLDLWTLMQLDLFDTRMGKLIFLNINSVNLLSDNLGSLLNMQYFKIFKEVEF